MHVVESSIKGNLAVWHPPEDDYVKINYDGATSLATNKLGMGYVCRNSRKIC